MSIVIDVIVAGVGPLIAFGMGCLTGLLLYKDHRTR